MGSLGGGNLQPCVNCKKFGGYFHKRGRAKYSIRICKRCDKKYDKKC